MWQERVCLTRGKNSAGERERDLLLVKLEELAVVGVEEVEVREVILSLVQLGVGGDGEREERLDR